MPTLNRICSVAADLGLYNEVLDEERIFLVVGGEVPGSSTRFPMG